MNEVDAAILDGWFRASPDYTVDQYECLKRCSTMFLYVARTLMRDIPPGFEREQALAKLRESWQWSLFAVQAP